ncbi:MAG: MFS transporter, partial [Sphingomonadales bacterium]
MKSLTAEQPSDSYRRRVLTLLVLVYMLNFIDRQIISVLALDLKRDLGLSDADLGFLYGTAFGVFYAVFGVAMGRLADGWNRVRMISIGLSVWSLMTALSGLSRTGVQLGAARVGVGIGEATASPCAYSLISDYFPRERRATALGIYATGTYIGTGMSLFLGAVILRTWNQAFPTGWHGLVGWQVAFFIVGLPGLVLALAVSRLREPVRGLSDGLLTPPAKHPFRDFLDEFVSVVPPFTLIGAARAGAPTLAVNLAAAALLGFAAYVIGQASGNVLQWAAIGVGFYAVFSWASALRRRDLPAFKLIWETPAFVLVVLAFGISAALNYAVAFWGLPYAESMLHADKATASLLIGGGSAAGGLLGLTIGGRVADRLRRTNPAGRVLAILFGFVAPVIPILIAFTTGNTTLFCLMYL